MNVTHFVRDSVDLIENQINDKSTISRNIVFDTILQKIY